MQDISHGVLPPLAVLVPRHQQRALQLAYRSLSDWQLAEDDGLPFYHFEA